MRCLSYTYIKTKGQLPEKTKGCLQRCILKIWARPDDFGFSSHLYLVSAGIVLKRFSRPIFQVVVIFEAVSADRTKIVFKMIFNTAAACKKVKVFAVDKNEEDFDKLEDELTKMTA